jgi:hypothetical protein
VISTYSISGRVVDWPRCELCIVQPYQSAYGVQVWSIGTVVNDEGESNASSWRWTRCSEGRVLGLERGTRVTGWLAEVANTWDTHSREDVTEWTVLLARSRTRGTRVQDVRYAHAVVWWLILEKPPNTTDDGVSIEFVLKTQWWRFRWESEATHGVIMKGVSWRNNFVWTAWLTH